jgi:hypothetical protein
VAGQSLVNGQALRLAALATDTVAVTMVNFYVNGQLLSSVASPPFLATYFTQPADASLTVSAVAYDAGGPGLAASVVVPVNPAQAPAAAVFLPLDGSQVVEGVAVPVLAGASDQAVGIANMSFFVNGARVAELVGPTPPYGITFTAPPAGQTTQIHVTATNVLGLQTTTPDVTVTSIADPGTAVLGTVVDPTGAALGGAVVAVTAQGGRRVARPRPRTGRSRWRACRPTRALSRSASAPRWAAARPRRARRRRCRRPVRTWTSGI